MELKASQHIRIPLLKVSVFLFSYIKSIGDENRRFELSLAKGSAPTVFHRLFTFYLNNQPGKTETFSLSSPFYASDAFIRTACWMALPKLAVASAFVRWLLGQAGSCTFRRRHEHLLGAKRSYLEERREWLL